MNTKTCPLCGAVITHKNSDVVNNIFRVHMQEWHPTRDY